MPNHCENDLYILGPDAEVAQVLAHIGADQTPPVFDFNAVMPYPEQYATMDKDAEILSRRDYQAKYNTWRDGFNSGDMSGDVTIGVLSGVRMMLNDGIIVGMLL